MVDSSNNDVRVERLHYFDWSVAFGRVKNYLRKVINDIQRAGRVYPCSDPYRSDTDNSEHFDTGENSDEEI